jgi:hypothetical protein
VVCLEKRSLVAKYSACVQHYAAALSDLAQLKATATDFVYRELAGRAETARSHCELAREALRAHRAQHGC